MKSHFKIYCCSLFFFPTALFSQKNYLVVDALTRKTISDVYVISANKNTIQIFSYSDGNGIIKIPASIRNDTICFSHISYFKKCISLKKAEDTIFLIRKSEVLDNVVIENLKTNKSKTIGYYKTKGKQILLAPSQFSTFGTIINIDTAIKKYKLQSFFCEFENLNLLERRKSQCKTGIIFYFLKVVNGTPIFENIIEPIIVDYSNLKERFSLKIPFSPVILNQTGEIFVGVALQNIDCLNTDGKYKSFELPIKPSPERNYNWVYYYKTAQWKNAERIGLPGKIGFSVNINYYEK